MNGSTGIGKLPDVSVDANAGDIFSHLQMAAMVYGEAYTDDWALGMDIIYMNLKQDAEPRGEVLDGSLHAKQFAAEFNGFRKLLPWLDLGVGWRVNTLTASARVNTDSPEDLTVLNLTSKKTWVDPIIIARIQNPEGEKLLYQFRGDIGGFGVGSQFAWQIQAYVGYRFSKLFQLSGGYRIISMDYNKGSDSNRFLYDVNTSGPVVRLGFNF